MIRGGISEPLIVAEGGSGNQEAEVEAAKGGTINFLYFLYIFFIIYTLFLIKQYYEFSIQVLE